MLSNSPVHTTLPAVDLKRAKKFYEQTLGLKVISEDPSGMVVQAGMGTWFYVYQRGPTKADQTVAEFEVDNIEAEVSQLKARGVKFEDYNIPSMGIKTINGIAKMGDMKGAWFKDTEGNILSVSEASPAKKEMMKSMAAAGK